MDEIIYTNTIRVKDYNILRESVGWKPIKENRAQTGLDNSAHIIAAKSADGRTVGMARLVSDGGYVAYIADVIVSPELQGRGVGKKMMNLMLEYINSTLEDDFTIMISLMSFKGRESFYNQFGFITRPNDDYGAGMVQWVTK